MPTITKRFVDSAKPGRHYDDKLTGFGLYVGKSGSRSYFLEYRPGRGRGVAKRRISIGKHGAHWTPNGARDRALELLAAVKDGRDPLAEREAAKSGVDTARLVSAVIDEWLKRDQAGNRSRGEVERIIRRDVLPALGDRPIEEIRKRDIIELIDSIADRGAKIMANRTLAHVKRLFKWAAGRDIIENDPAAHVERPASETRRDRVLNDRELARIWNAADVMGYPFGNAIQLLILTGARRQEVLGLSWQEVDLSVGAIRLPASRTKIKEGRLIPLSPPAAALLRKLLRFEAGSFVFSFDGQNPFANAGRDKPRLDRIIGELQRGQVEQVTTTENDVLPHWTVHDIRRSVATGLQRLGVMLEVIETILGHISGSRSGVVGVYQRHRFEVEARAALVAWGEHLAAITKPTDGASVLPFAQKG